MAIRVSAARLVFLLALAGCVGPVSDASVDEAEAPAEAAKADGTSTEIRVRAGETTLWVDTLLARQDRAGVDTLVLRGRTSRTVVDGRGFVFDDVYGAFAKTSTRGFEVSWTTGEARSLLTGVNQYLGLELAPSSSRPTHLAARAIVRARLTGFSGSGIYLVSDLKPVVSGGRVVWRIRGNTGAVDLDAIRLAVGDLDVPDVRLTGARTFEADLLEDHVLQLAHRAERITLTATAGDRELVKRASLVLVVSRLGLTDGDPVETWPPASCTDRVRDCLRALPPGTSDLGSCGEAIEVLQCAPSTGVTVDDVAFQAALRALDDQLAGAAMRADANALVGPGRAEAWLEGVHLTAESRLERELGNTYSDAAARDAALAAAVDGAVDESYAFPLDLVEPLAPIPGDEARTRDVLADALLAYAAEQDWEATALWRPLIVLTDRYRDRHVSGVGAFRAGGPDIEISGNTYVGRWLDLYTELTFDPATGTAARVYVEID